jgi:tetratricopeptide (TPR) repeat protein
MPRLIFLIFRYWLLVAGLPGEPDLGSLDRMVAMGREGAVLVGFKVGFNHRVKAAVLYNLGDDLRRRFVLTRQRQDLEDAVEAARESVASTRRWEWWRGVYLESLGRCLVLMYSFFDANSLPEAAEVLARAVKHTKLQSNLPERLELLFVALAGAPTTCGADVAKSVEKAVERVASASREYLTGTSPSNGGRQDRAKNLVVGLLVKALLNGDKHSIQEAVEAVRWTLQLVEDGGLPDSYATEISDTLAVVTQSRISNDALLDVAVEMRVIAVRSESHDDPNHENLEYLGDLLVGRFNSRGDPSDLDEAIQAARRAVALAPDGSESWSSPSLTLGTALMLFAVHENDDKALNEAVKVLRETRDKTPPNDPLRLVYLSILSGCLWKLFDRTGAAAVLDEGILAAQEVVQPQFEHTGAVYWTAAANMSLLLWGRFRASHHFEDLDEAIALTARAVEPIPIAALGVDRAISLLNYGEMLAERYAARGDLQDRAAALEALAGAVASGPGAVRYRVEAACFLTKIAADSGLWDEALRAMSAAVDLLPLMAPRHFHRVSQQRMLSRFPTLASDGAAVALRKGRASRAIELLEQGRGVVLSYALETRGDVTELRERYPGLADRFDRTRLELDAASVLPAGIVLTAKRAEPGLRRRKVSESWHDLLAEIRSCPGMERFNMPPSAGELADVVSGGPVVAVNVSGYGTDAILLTSAGVRVVSLPHLKPEAVTAHASAFDDAIRLGSDERATLIDNQRAEGTVRETLGWLWDNVTEPVFNALALNPARVPGDKLPRIWWMPTGLLSFLPLHAAGHYDSPAGPSSLDWVVASYTPTLRALLRARRRKPTEPASRSLIVALTELDNPRPLSQVMSEANALANMLPGAVRLIDADASHSQVLENLNSAQLVHFACHGYSDKADPSASHLVLHDQALSVLELNPLHLEHGQLAMLAACSTSRTTAALPDESIHLSGAFQLAGHRHVIGTMWPVADDIARDFATHFYRELLERHDPDTAGHAADVLHSTVQEIRKEWPETPSLWTAWNHVGP